MTEEVKDDKQAPNAEEITLNIGEAPKPDEVKKDEQKVDLPDGAVVEYEKTGDVGLDLALEFIGKQGFSGDHPAVQAASQGDFTLLEALLAQKGVQGYGPMIELGKQAYKRAEEKAKTDQTNLRNTIVEITGGAENWANIQKWAAANATPEEKAAINAQLNAGGVQTKMAAKYLADIYAKANNVDFTPENPASGAGGGARPGNSGPLGPREYAQEVQALARKLGGRMESSQEYAALGRRRAAFRG